MPPTRGVDGGCGALDGDPEIRPRWRQWVSSAPDWYALPEDGLPRFPKRTPTVPPPAGSPLNRWPPQRRQNDFESPTSGFHVPI